MGYVLGISNDGQAIEKVCNGFDLRLLVWPEQGLYGPGASQVVNEACARIEDLESVDCILCQCLTSAPVLFELRRKGYHGPVVLVPHYNPYPVRNLLHCLLFAQCLTSTDVVFAGSTVAANRYGKFFKSAIVPKPAFGIDTEVFFNKGKNDSRKRMNLPDSKILLYTGRLQSDKNVGSLLTVYRSLRVLFGDLCLVLSAVFSDRCILTAVRQETDNVIVFENSDKTRLSYLYSAADVFVSCSTSYHETFGRSPLECIACGTPVVVPDWDGFRDYVGSEVGRRVHVDMLDTPIYDKGSYAIVSISDFIDACVDMLHAPPAGPIALDPSLSSEAISKRTHEILARLINQTRGHHSDFAKRDISAKNQRIGRIIRALEVDSVEKLFELSLCSRRELPKITGTARKELYAELFW